jgi:predicted  nucleic acid-binding Zn-ribbon protein
LKNQVEALENEISARQHEIDAITKDQARVREHMKALKGSAEEKALLQRYARQLDQQEDRLNNLQKEINDLNGRKTQEDAELDRIVQAIVLDQSL